MEIWHDPPPWTALPVKDNGWMEPSIILVAMSAVQVTGFWHGKPPEVRALSARGELIVPGKILGVFMKTCA